MHHISPGKYKTIWLASMCSIISKHTYFLLKVDLHYNLPHFRNVSSTSVTQCGEFFKRAHFLEKTGKKRAFFQQKKTGEKQAELEFF